MKQKGASELDKAIWTIYEGLPYINWDKPYEHTSYLTYYAEEGLYLVIDTLYHAFRLMKADSPKEAVYKVVDNNLAYLPEVEG